MIHYRTRVAVIGGAFCIAFVLLASRAVYLLVSERAFQATNVILATKTPASLSELAKQAKKIDSVTGDIDDYTLGEIKNLLNDTAALASNASLELKAQSDAWDKIKSKAAADASTYQELKHNLDLVTGMQNAEIVRLNRMLEGAKQPTRVQDVLTAIGSFMLGIFSSWAATAIQVRFKAWRRVRRGRNAAPVPDDDQPTSGEPQAT